MFPGDQNRRAQKLVLINVPATRAPASTAMYKQVLMPRFPDLRFGSAQGNASYRKQLFRQGWFKVDWHKDVLSVLDQKLVILFLCLS